MTTPEGGGAGEGREAKLLVTSIGKNVSQLH